MNKKELNDMVEEALKSLKDEDVTFIRPTREVCIACAENWIRYGIQAGYEKGLSKQAYEKWHKAEHDRVYNKGYQERKREAEIDLLQEKAKSVLKGKKEGWKEALERIEKMAKESREIIEALGYKMADEDKYITSSDWKALKKEV